MDRDEELRYLREENKRLNDLLHIQTNSAIDNETIEDLVDIEEIEKIFTKFSKLTGYTTGLVKQDTREVLVSTGWTEICKNFHRGNESSAFICQESNAELTKNLKKYHQVAMHECQHGMVDGATPIIIDNKHLADIFSGQVLLNKPDIEKFKKGAEQYGYDVEAYLEALKKVKIVNQETLKEVLDFLASIAKLIAEIGKEKKEYLKLNALLENKIKERVKETQSLLTLFDNSDNVLFKWNNNKEWDVSFVSKSVMTLLGYTKEEFESKKITFFSCVHPDDISRLREEVNKNINENKSFFRHEPYRIICKNGEVKWILDNKALIKEGNSIPYFLGYLSGITTIKNYQHKLEYLSSTDQLTKVKNRLYIDEVLKEQQYKFIRNNESCSLILIDIDYFKDINDTYGHIVGDQFLVEFAALLKSKMRESDILGRWGGEEFLIILPHTPIDKAKDIAYKLREIISNFKFKIVGPRTASFGVASFFEGVTSSEVLDNADKALYRSKEEGRNRVRCFFSNSPHRGE